MNEDNYFKYPLEYQRCLIDRNIFIYLKILITYIFIDPDKCFKNKSNVKKKLEEITKKINDNIIKEKEKLIDLSYNKENLLNILEFAKKQNKIFAGDILEGILIIVFSKAFKTEKTNTFGKYIFNNLQKINDSSDLTDWFESGNTLFAPQELKNVKELLIVDTFIQDRIENANAKQIESPFLNFLHQILINKYNALFQIKNKKNKAICYINKGENESHDNSSKIFDIISKNESNRSTLQEKDNSLNYLFNIYSRLR